MSEQEYPTMGYAPGNYRGKCNCCGETFQGDKHAFNCKSCAAAFVKAEKYTIDVIEWLRTQYHIEPSTESIMVDYSHHTIKEAFKELNL